jgi:hypothetical protein
MTRRSTGDVLAWGEFFARLEGRLRIDDESRGLQRCPPAATTPVNESPTKNAKRTAYVCPSRFRK